MGFEAGGVKSKPPEKGGGLADIPHPRTWKFIQTKWAIR